MADRLIGHLSRTKGILRLLGCLAFVALSLWLLLAPDMTAKAKFAGVGGIVVFGWFGLQIGLSLLRNTPTLVIDDAGVLDTRSVDRPIPWSEIKGMREKSVAGKRFLYIDIGEPVDRFTNRGAKASMLTANQGFAQGVPVNHHGLDVTFEQVEAALKARLS